MSAGGLRVEWVVRRERFVEIAPSWDRAASREPLPFALSPWVLAWWDGFAARDGMRIAVVWRDGEVVAGAPFAAGWRRWATAANGTAPLAAFVARDDRARERLVAEILARSPGYVDLRGLEVERPWLLEIVRAARAAGRWVLEPRVDSSLTVDTTGSFDDYHGALSTKVRRETRRLRRKAEREHRFIAAPLAEPVDLDAELRAALELEARGWKGRTGTAAISRPDTARFFCSLARNFHALGALRLSRLELDGSLAAMGIGIVHARGLYTLRVAYDESHRAVGPGFLLLLATIERCFETGLDRYEFCGTPEEYEQRFSTGRRAHGHVRLYHPSALAAGRYVYRRELHDRLRTLRDAVRARDAAALHDGGSGHGHRRTREVTAALFGS